MMKLMILPVFAGLCTFAAILPASPALAQEGAFPVHEMDFGMWCQEEKRLPYARCIKRLPKDVKEFQTYRHIIEKYEIRDILNKRHTLSIANIRNAADSDTPTSKTESDKSPKR